MNSCCSHGSKRAVAVQLFGAKAAGTNHKVLCWVGLIGEIDRQQKPSCPELCTPAGGKGVTEDNLLGVTETPQKSGSFSIDLAV